jgi:hypothetical protein
MASVWAVLGIARRTVYYRPRARAGGRYHQADDETVLQQIRAVTEQPRGYGSSTRAERTICTQRSGSLRLTRHVGLGRRFFVGASDFNPHNFGMPPTAFGRRW